MTVGVLAVVTADEVSGNHAIANYMADYCVSPDALLPVQLVQETIHVIGVEAGGETSSNERCTTDDAQP